MGTKTFSNIKIISKAPAKKPIAPQLEQYKPDFFEKENKSPIAKKVLDDFFSNKIKHVPLQTYLDFRKRFKKYDTRAFKASNDEEKNLLQGMQKYSLLQSYGDAYRASRDGINLIDFYSRYKLIPLLPKEPCYGLEMQKPGDAFYGGDVHQTNDMAFTYWDHLEGRIGDFIELGTASGVSATVPDETRLAMAQTEVEKLKEKFSSNAITAHPILFDSGSGEVVLAIRYQKKMYYVSTPKRYFNYLYAKTNGNIKIKANVEDLTSAVTPNQDNKERKFVSLVYTDKEDKPIGYLKEKSYVVAPEKKHFADIERALQTFYKDAKR